MSDVVPQDLRTAAGNADDASTVVRAHVPTEIGEVAAALEGGTAGGVASSLSTTWSTAYTTWATDMEAYAETLRSTATAWETADTNAGSEFSSIRMPVS